MRKFLWLALAILLPFGPSHAAGGGGTVTVSRITLIGGSIYVFASGIGNPDGCASTAHFTIAAENPGRDQMLSVLIAAKLNRSQVTLWFDGCSYSPWATSAPRVGALTME
jgi:hypothetical protein